MRNGPADAPGRPRRPAETLAEYAGRLDDLSAGEDATWSRLAAAAEASAYGGLDPPPETQRTLALEARRARVRPRDAMEAAEPPGRPLVKL